MRTKTLLLSVAAAFAVGLTSLQAQVYSLNVVGYANVVTPGNGTIYYLLSVPFQIGASNGANEIWPLISPNNPSIPDGSEILTWNGSGYNAYLSDSQSGSLWDDNNDNPLTFSPTLPVGEGFFLVPANNTTNVFAGTVSVNVGSSNTMSLPGNGTTYYLVGGTVPYAGAVTNGNNSGGGLNLAMNNNTAANLDGSELLIWNGSGYTAYLSDSTSSSLWDDNNGNPIGTPPSVTVGQGFFLVPSANFPWTEGLTGN